jgi:hypothetical protein
MIRRAVLAAKQRVGKFMIFHLNENDDSQRPENVGQQRWERNIYRLIVSNKGD